MASKVDICNLAIGHLGAEQITSMTDGSPEAIACANFWDISRDAVLASMHWSFAIKRQELSQSATTPDFGWDYQYPLPSDFLEPIVINQDAEPKWSIEGGMIMTDEDEVELVYIARVTDTATYPSMFVDAFGTRLAADICPAVTRDFSLQQTLMQLFDYKINAAKDHDAGRAMEFERDDMDKDNFTWVSERR